MLHSPAAAATNPSQSPIPPAQSLPPTSQPSEAVPAPFPPAHSSQPIFDFSSTLASSAAGPSGSTPAAHAPPSFYDANSFLNFASTPSTTTGGGGGGAIDHTQFGSEAANLEYAILSSMLNGNGFALDAHTPNLSGGIGGGHLATFDPRFGGGGGAQNGRTADDQLLGGATNRNDVNGHDKEPGFGQLGQDKQQGDAEMFSASGTGPGPTEKGPQNSGSGVPGLMTAEEALRSVTKPYPYAQSYHFLVKHLKTR